MRAMLTLGLAAVVATPAAAQWLGEPVWNSPKGGTGVTGAVGFSVPLPTPGISIEPYFSPGIRYHGSGGANTTQFGYVFGANLSFGLVGLHLAYDNERLKGGGNRGVFGVGAHLDLHLPLGM